MRSDDGGDSKDTGGGATNAPLLTIAHKLLARHKSIVCVLGRCWFVCFLPYHDIPLRPLHTGSLSRISVTKCQDIIQLMLSSATLK